jgi:hypothetical protein
VRDAGICHRGQNLVASWTECIVDRVVGWSTVAVVVTVTVLFLTLIEVSSCADAAQGEGTSFCTTESMLGVAGLLDRWLRRCWRSRLLHLADRPSRAVA